MLDFTRNTACVMSTRNGRRISSATCETKKSKRQVFRNKYLKNPEKQRASSWAYSLTSYWKNPDKKRASSHTRYWEDPETKRVSSHARYWEDPETKRVSSHTRYWEDPDKGRAASRVSSRTSYWRNPDKKRAAVRLSNLKVARAKLKWYRQYYVKHKKGICFQEKQVCIGRTKGFCNRSSCEENTAPASRQCWG